MLYISRVINGEYGVVDTDDGTETFVSYKELDKCINAGLTINGVIPMDLSHIYSDSASHYSIDMAMPYQPVPTLVQTKIAMLQGAETCVYNDELVRVSVASSDRVPVVRLSDICKRFNFDYEIFFKRFCPCVLVFDDSIEFAGKFRSGDFQFFSPDVSACSDNNPILDVFYYSLFDEYDTDEIEKRIIDREPRKSHYKLLSRMSRALLPSDKEFVELKSKPGVAEFLAAKLIKPVREYFGVEFTGQIDVKFDERFIVRALKRVDFDYLIKHYNRVDAVLINFTADNYNYHESWRIQNYFEKFEVAPEFVELYLDVCQRIAERL